jgi:hypothetical protein
MKIFVQLTQKVIIVVTDFQHKLVKIQNIYPKSLKGRLDYVTLGKIRLGKIKFEQLSPSSLFIHAMVEIKSFNFFLNFILFQFFIASF